MTLGERIFLQKNSLPLFAGTRTFRFFSKLKCSDFTGHELVCPINTLISGCTDRVDTKMDDQGQLDANVYISMETTAGG